MPNLTVIDGGGRSRDWERQQAEAFFKAFAIALVRGVGGGNQHPVTSAFFRFLEHMQATEIPVGPVIDAAVQELHDEAFREDEGALERRIELMELRHAAWRASVEYMTDDGLARARQSKRDSELRDAIDQVVHGHETRTRQNGWSYMDHLAKRLGKFPPRRK